MKQHTLTTELKSNNGSGLSMRDFLNGIKNTAREMYELILMKDRDLARIGTLYTQLTGKPFTVDTLSTIIK